MTRPQVIQGQVMSDGSVIGRPIWSYISRISLTGNLNLNLAITGEGKTRWIRLRGYGGPTDICAISYTQTSPGLPPPPGGTMQTGADSITYFAGDDEVLVQVSGIGKINVQATTNSNCSLEGYE